jgi:hypothetical protein
MLIPPSGPRDGAIRRSTPGYQIQYFGTGNSFHLLLRETLINGVRPTIPDDLGLLAMLFYAPNATIKPRRPTPDSSQILPSRDDCVFRLCQGRMRVTEQSWTKGWALVGSLGNDQSSGIFPTYDRLSPPPEALSTAYADNVRIRDAGIKTRNYDTGFDRFVRKFNPEEEMSATLALFRGHHGDHGWEVYCAQGSRRCCLLDTTFSLTDEEVLWTGLSAWANSQPRQRKPSQNAFTTLTSPHMYLRSIGIICLALANMSTSQTNQNMRNTTCC